MYNFEDLLTDKLKVDEELIDNLSGKVTMIFESGLDGEKYINIKVSNKSLVLV